MDGQLHQVQSQIISDKRDESDKRWMRKRLERLEA